MVEKGQNAVRFDAFKIIKKLLAVLMKSISHSQAATCLSYREKFKKNAGS